MTEPHPEIAIVGEFGLVDGVLRTHEASECALPYCAVHNPSAHPLRDAPQRWRTDVSILERLCPHGFGHPDFDSLFYVQATKGGAAAAALSVHTCDGCCGMLPPGIDGGERG